MRNGRRAWAAALALFVALAAGACGTSPSVQPSPETAERPVPPQVPDAWSAWIQGHHFPIRSTSTADADFADLQFLKGVIGGRRLVQLGESGHGVGEFDSTKVRLVHFFHEQMGFDVMAFESGLYECFRADEKVDTLTADALMKSCIFGVWHADETVPLFEYIKSTRGTDHPLTLAGFDTQFSTGTGRARPAELREMLAVIDPVLADDAFALDTELQRLASLDRAAARGEVASELDDMVARYETIAQRIDREQARLERAFPERPLFPRVMGQAMRQAPSLLRSLAADMNGYGAHRDEGMAENVTWLARTLYPERKILIWAHNYHVQYDAQAESQPAVPNMGSFLVQRHRPELYTMGLFMYWGQAAWNNRTVYTITPPPPNSLEALFGRTTAAAPASFVDLLGQSPEPGTAWMFQPITAKVWGVTDEQQTPRRQYDGILFVDHVHPPHYR